MKKNAYNNARNLMSSVRFCALVCSGSGGGAVSDVVLVVGRSCFLSSGREERSVSISWCSGATAEPLAIELSPAWMGAMLAISF